MSEAISVEAGSEDGLELPVTLERVEEAVRFVLAEERVDQARVSVALVGEGTIAALNEQYLAHEGATDVISFALHGPAEPPLGDVYIGVEQAARQADEAGVSGEEELLRLAVHGVLHVLGHDHPDGGEREGSPMYLRQEELLGVLLARFRTDGG